MASKSPIELAQEFAQAAVRVAPVIILGSGASAAHGVPGMGPLANHLSQLMVPSKWGAGEIEEWTNFCDRLTVGVDLESALGAVRLSDVQTEYIADKTRDFLLPYDLNVFEAALTDSYALPLSRLFKHLFASTHRTLDIITPNYDRLAEYAADLAGCTYYTGFMPGHIQNKVKQGGMSVFFASTRARTVNVWKVHGSFDWFRNSMGQTISAPACKAIPPGCSPLMITPGVEKYRLTHGEPFRTIFAECDGALEKARSYLCIGYGFNDPHVQEKLIERCDGESTPIVIVTHTLSPTTLKLLDSGKCRKYVAIEAHAAGSVIRTPDHPKGLEVSGRELWRLDQFLDFTIGN